MPNGKLAAQQAKDLLSVCLAKAIQKAMYTTQGPRWFETFSQEDQQEEPGHRILKTGQVNIMDLDLQALLKILRYRESYADRILSFYGFITADEYAAKNQKRQLRSLLDRLITEFRNQMEAHVRVADIEKSFRQQPAQGLYGYQEALQDMEKLAGIFQQVRDSSGVSYYDRICQLRNAMPGKKKRLWLIPAGIAAALVIAAGVWLLATPPRTQTAETPAPTTGNVFYNPDNAVFTEGKVTILPMHVYYEGDQVVAKCFVLNGTDKTAENIRVDGLIFLNGDEAICAGQFGLLEDMTLQPHTYEEWIFVFPEELVERWNGDFTGALRCISNCTYDS